jgi:hypothetical protein
MNDHGCALNDDAAQRAASNKLRSFPGSTARFSNMRGLQRWLINSWTGVPVCAGFSNLLMVIPPE